MKIVLTIIVTALLGLFTNLLSEKLSLRFSKRSRTVFFVFFLLVSLTIALAVLPSEADAAKTVEEYKTTLAFFGGAVLTALVATLLVMRFLREDWEKKEYIVLNWHCEFHILPNRLYQKIDKYRVEVLRDGFELFPCRYSWSGSETGGAPSLALPGQILLGELTETGTGIAYYVKLQHRYPRGTIVDIEVSQTLTDEKGEVQPYFGINVTRPLKQIHLKLAFDGDLPKVLQQVVSDGRINIGDVVRHQNVPVLNDQKIYEWVTNVKKGYGYAFVWRYK